MAQDYSHFSDKYQTFDWSKNAFDFSVCSEYTLIILGPYLLCNWSVSYSNTWILFFNCSFSALSDNFKFLCFWIPWYLIAHFLLLSFNNLSCLSINFCSSFFLLLSCSVCNLKMEKISKNVYFTWTRLTFNYFYILYCSTTFQSSYPQSKRAFHLLNLEAYNCDGKNNNRWHVNLFD